MSQLSINFDDPAAATVAIIPPTPEGWFVEIVEFDTQAEREAFIATVLRDELGKATDIGDGQVKLQYRGEHAVRLAHLAYVGGECSGGRGIKDRTIVTIPACEIVGAIGHRALMIRSDAIKVEFPVEICGFARECQLYAVGDRGDLIAQRWAVTPFCLTTHAA